MKLDPQLLEFAKAMRSNATDAENIIWQLLRAKRFMNLKFSRQHVIAPYIVDYYFHDSNLSGVCLFKKSKPSRVIFSSFDPSFKLHRFSIKFNKCNPLFNISSAVQSL